MLSVHKADQGHLSSFKLITTAFLLLIFEAACFCEAAETIGTEELLPREVSCLVVEIRSRQAYYVGVFSRLFYSVHIRVGSGDGIKYYRELEGDELKGGDTDFALSDEMITNLIKTEQLKPYVAQSEIKENSILVLALLSDGRKRTFFTDPIHVDGINNSKIISWIEGYAPKAYLFFAQR